MGAPEEESEDFPEWYLLVKAAQWLGVAPWELADQPLIWMHWGLAGLSAENKAEKTKMERANKKRSSTVRKK